MCKWTYIEMHMTTANAAVNKALQPTVNQSCIVHVCLLCECGSEASVPLVMLNQQQELLLL